MSWQDVPVTETTAVLHTSEGDIRITLFPDHAPKTVRNFVGLATGEQEWTDPATRAKRNDPLYDGVVFHRIIPGFMIQGGDPLGTGTGGPGYQFADEFQSPLPPTHVMVVASECDKPHQKKEQMPYSRILTDTSKRVEAVIIFIRSPNGFCPCYRACQPALLGAVRARLRALNPNDRPAPISWGLTLLF